MEESVQSFDSAVGGTEALPNMYSISDFLKQRVEEVVNLTETIKKSPFRGQTFQRLPKHMRRRQMSHFIKRLPRRLQRPYLLSLKDGLPAPTKCPSRKYRRRPSNLLLEYNRRQRDNTWLETHIWHAKRFHMVQKWGYKLPQEPTNKSFRACYRAISEHCLVTDISYYNCIELMGPQTVLLNTLRQCTSSECGLTFAAKMYLDGKKEGSVTIFQPNSYPDRVIGNVTFMWNPVTVGEDAARQIWIWVHPLMHNEVVECFKVLFNLKEIVETVGGQVTENKTEEIEPKSDVKEKTKKTKRRVKKSKGNMENLKFVPKNVPASKVPKWTTDDGSVRMSLLKDTLNRFQMTGPLSQAVISQAFHVATVKCDESRDDDVEVIPCGDGKRRKVDGENADFVKKRKTEVGEDRIEGRVDGAEPWWRVHYEGKEALTSWNLQKDLYERLGKCSKPTDVPGRMIVPLVVGDPRLIIPAKREKAVPRIQEFHQIPDDLHQSPVSHSPIWDSTIRDQASMSKLSVAEINQFRSKMIVPGCDVRPLIPDEKQSRIPIVLVQRPGVATGGRPGLGSGWDIICPAGFGMPVWLALIFRGARSGGLRETELLQLECGRLNGCLQPDSSAGQSDEGTRGEERKTEYFKLPPGKRPNFIKLAVPCPFHVPWDLLVRSWIDRTGGTRTETTDEPFKVLRSRQALERLGEAVKRPSKGIGWDGYDRYLVPVAIECVGKGKPRDLAMICLPGDEDVCGRLGPTEPVHSDENEAMRQKARLEHSKVLKALRRKRRKNRRKLRETFAKALPDRLKWEDVARSNVAPSDDVVSRHRSKIESLWVPDTDRLDTFIDYPTRTILGFVVRGDFTFSKASSTALGYVTHLGLRVLVERAAASTSRKLTVLVRNRDERQYRFGRLTIVQE